MGNQLIDVEELQEAAAADARRIFAAWKRPALGWPAGTQWEDPPFSDRRIYGSSFPIVWAVLPCGDRYLLLLDGKEPDPREVPPVLWDLWANTYGELFATPRMANMKQWSPEEDKQRLWRCGGLGLEPSYKIGRLPRGIAPRVRTVSDGWGY